METKITGAYELSMFGDAFNSLKTDFDQVLKRLLNNMESRESEEGQISIALKVSLQKSTAPDHEITAYEAERDIIVPLFAHKIKSVLTLKDEKSGKLGGEQFELVWDKESCKYILRPVKSSQISLFDTDDEDAEDTVDIPDLEEYGEDLEEDGDGYEYEGAADADDAIALAEKPAADDTAV